MPSKCKITLCCNRFEIKHWHCLPYFASSTWMWWKTRRVEHNLSTNILVEVTLTVGFMFWFPNDTIFSRIYLWSMALYCIFYQPAFFILSSIPCSSIYSSSLEFNLHALQCIITMALLWSFLQDTLCCDILLTFDFGRNTPQCIYFVIADVH